MTEEQTGSASVDKPPETPAPQPVAEKPAESVAPQVNWETGDNPFYQRWKSVDGQIKAREREKQSMQKELSDLRQQMQGLSQERQWSAEDSQQSALEALLTGATPEEVVEKLGKQVAANKEVIQARRQWQRQAQQQWAGDSNSLRQEVHRDYTTALNEASQEFGLSRDELGQLSTENSDLQTYLAAWGKKVGEKLTTPLIKEFESKLGDMRKAITQQVLAELRGGEPKPDLTTAQAPPGGDENAKFLVDFASGASNDLKRAQALLDQIKKS